MKCNYCNSSEYNTVSEYTRFEKNKVFKCKKCELVYLESNKNKKTIETFYASEYRTIPTLVSMTAQEHSKNDVVKNDIKNRIAFALQHTIIKDKTILEIGSASGGFLLKLLECGAKEVAGIELCKEYAEFSRKYQLEIYEKSIEELSFVNKFDIIVSFHTIEHVFDPLLIFKKIYRSLKPGGIFLGEVPNQDDWRIKIFNDEVIKRFHYDPNHLYYFSPKTLKNYLETCNFENIHFETIERYNSFLQIKNILNREQNKEYNEDEILKKFIFPKNKEDETRLAATNNNIQSEFNRIFGKGINSELMGNCLRWTVYKK